MIVPRTKAVILLGAVLPVMIATMATTPDAWVYCAYGAAILVAVIAADMLMLYIEPPPAFELSLPNEIGIGEPGEAVLDLTRHGRGRPSRTQAVVEFDGPLDELQVFSSPVAGGESISAVLPFKPTKRGIVDIRAMWLRYAGPLGLSERRLRQSLDLSCTVVPNIAAVQRMALDLQKLSRDFGQKQQRFHGDGSEFEALREFVPGMDTRYVDWKQSARHRKLLVKEMKAERNHNVIVAFDTGHLMSELVDDIPKLDHAINAGLKLASLALSSGDLVGLYSFAEEAGSFIRPIRGQTAFGQFRHHTARLHYSPTESNFTLALTHLSARLHRRSLIVLFTDFVDTVSAELLLDNMRLLAQRHLILFVCLKDPLLHRLIDDQPANFDNVAEAVVADEFLQERTIVFEKLRRLGIFVLDVSAEALSPDLINGYLGIKQRELL